MGKQFLWLSALALHESSVNVGTRRFPQGHCKQLLMSWHCPRPHTKTRNLRLIHQRTSLVAADRSADIKEAFMCGDRAGRAYFKVSSQDMKLLFPVLVMLVVLLTSCGSSGDFPLQRDGTPADTSRPPLLDGATFDYVVVGAGAAGSAVAARLALAGHEVLLIEAGGDPGLLSKIPNAAMALMGTDIDWFYKTVPNNKSCLSLRGRQCRFSRGLCLGGSTSINYMLYTRGNPHDYDFDVPGWSWRDLKPYFLQYEGLQSLDQLPPASQEYHNTTGRVAISVFDRSINPWNQRIVKGLRSLKFPFNSDVNAKSQIGVSRVLGYVFRGERVSTARAYLTREVTRKLTIAANTRCTGVIIDGKNNARGITAVDKISGAPINMYAKHEVILSAGTVGSAQLLMLSGVGATDHLEHIGIPVRADLPVGENMSDHVLPLLIIKVDSTSETVPNLHKILGVKGLDVIQWLSTRSGPLASLSVTDVVGFANTQCYDFKARRLKNNSSNCSVPNLQIIFAYIDRYTLYIFPDILKRIFNKNVFDQMLNANKNNAFLIASPILLRPKSRGRIRLANKDPMTPPAITPNFLDVEDDVKDMVTSIEIIEQLLQTSVFIRNNASFLKLKLPGCSGDRRAYWECYVRHMTSSGQHAVGTVAVGKAVDERLRVRGVGGLRVADLSVLPLVPRGNTAAAAIAVGERLADILLKERNSLG